MFRSSGSLPTPHHVKTDRSMSHIVKSGMTGQCSLATNRLRISCYKLDTYRLGWPYACRSAADEPIIPFVAAISLTKRASELKESRDSTIGRRLSLAGRGLASSPHTRWTLRKSRAILPRAPKLPPSAHTRTAIGSLSKTAGRQGAQRYGLLDMLFKPSVAFGLLSIILASPAHADCSDRTSRLSALIASRDYSQAESIVAENAVVRECSPTERARLKRQLADALVDEAGRKGANSEALITKAASFGTSWKAHAALGDLETGRREFAAAAVAFQVAINLIDAGSDDEIARIPRQTIERIGRRAEETRHLAATGTRGLLVPAPATRDGGPGGVYNPILFRGAEAVRLPSPIQFQYNSVEFSAVGKQAAEDFVAFVKSVSPKTIRITGHTDRVGSDEFNLDLSRRRAASVAALLKAEGVDAEIRVFGKGKSEPRQLSDPSAYDQEQIDTLDRRVEFELRK